MWDGIYVSHYDELRSGKRLQRQPKGVIRVTSDCCEFAGGGDEFCDRGADCLGRCKALVIGFYSASEILSTLK
jgi:hypothetical protein